MESIENSVKDSDNSIISKISENIIKKALTNEEIKMEELWENHSCVIIFFRRFGCVFCRQSAKEISQLAPILARNNIRLIGLGFDELGVEEFIEGGYFGGEVYLDPLQVNYKALQHKRYSHFGIIVSLLSKKLCRSFMKIKNEGVTGNLRGDAFQNGGALVVTSKSNGSRVLLSFKQENPVDYVSNCDVLNVLEIST